MHRFAIRITPEFMEMIEMLTGPVDNPFEETPFVVATVVSETEINMKIMTEEEMLVEYTTHPDLQIMN